MMQRERRCDAAVDAAVDSVVAAVSSVNAAVSSVDGAVSSVKDSGNHAPSQ